MAPPSSYYPPRARNAATRAFRPALYRLQRIAGRFFSRSLEIGSLTLPLGTVLISLLVPGFIFYVAGPRRLFPIMLSGYCLAVLVYIAWLGYTASSLAFMVLLSVHVTSIAQLFKHLTPSAGLKLRMLTSLATFVIMFWGVYGFLQQQLARVVVPMRVNGNVVIVRSCNPKTIEVGDTIAYRVDPRSGAGFRVHEGMGIDRVLARAGDTIVFTEKAYEINGVVFARLPHMPAAGDWTVPGGNWFVWPSFAVAGYNFRPETVSSELMMYAMISKETFIGKPCKYWLWRKQF